ncbi:Rne/Rng family ribonuclease [Nocardioides currus]|uniref:Ribonuclease E n=1 Tax=Nocardioides currus TaxID=2133958 RepID=A0A2R7YX54_9ACTN|nr:Rne/Rng family ribonuclease [Nocardioides currus]PUA80901.1 ribonuclease E/G [Nocardioides currus]
MLDDNPNDTTDNGSSGSDTSDAPAAPVVKKTTRRAPRKTAATAAAAAPVEPVTPDPAAGVETPTAPAVKKTTRTRSSAKKAAATPPASVQDSLIPDAAPAAADADAPVAPAKKAPAKKAAAKKTAAKKTTAKKTTTKKAAAVEPTAEQVEAVEAPVEDAPAAPVVKKTTRTRTRKTAAPEPATESPAAETGGAPSAVPLFQAPETAPRRTRATKKAAATPADDTTADTTADSAGDSAADAEAPAKPAKKAAAKKTTKKSTSKKKAAAAPVEDEEETSTEVADAETAEDADATESPDTDAADAADGAEGTDAEGEGDGTGPARRRRRRGGRRRRKGGEGSADGQDAESDDDSQDADKSDTGPQDSEQTEQGDGTSRRRRRRRRAGEEGDDSDDEPNTVTRVRNRRAPEDQITALAGSTRLEAKKQRRREGREAGRRRAPIVSEAEFLARRESVDRVMVIRQRKELTQIAVLEDKVLVEHYVARESQTSLIGNVYLGRVQNVLPSMEAAFIDIGKGRNAVLYAGEVNWSALGHKEGQPRKIESVLSSGQSVLVQVTKDPIGHKGARLTSQVSLAGRFLVYVPDGTTSGISRKLPDTERNRLKTLLKEIVPDTAGVIVRTAAEGASEEELTHDVERLKARWEDIESKAKGSAPQLLYGEPDLTLKVVRDLFTEDFAKLVIEGDDAWDTVQGYVSHVAPDLADRLEKFEPATEGRAAGKDVFTAYRIEEQIQKGLDRKVWLPSGGSLIIDRTEAMTVVDVNTGKFTGSGGNLEETVTKNNLEAAEEIVRQLRLRDIGGIIVVDFIDMVLESNRDLVVRRLVECLGRDRTRHQVAEVTSLGLVQMTRKRIGTGLLEAFSTDCEHCHGRGVVITAEPVEAKGESDDGDRRSSGRRNRGRGRGEGGNGQSNDNGNGNANGGGNGSSPSPSPAPAPSPKDVAAMPRHDHPVEAETSGTEAPDTETPDTETPGAAASVEVPSAVDVPAEAPDAPEGTETPGGETSAQEPAQESAPESAETPVEQAGEPKGAEPAVEAPAEEPAVEAPVEPVKPQVVTRTRRRSATRPAGPPVVPPVGVAGQRPESGLVEPGTAGLEPGPDSDDVPAGEQADEHADEPHVEHVPIKKRGSRKR